MKEILNYAVYSFSITAYIFIFLRIFAPRLIGKKYNKDKFSSDALPNEINKNQFFEKLQFLPRNKAKEEFFKAIGKTKFEITIDKISNYAKNILKFFPLFYFSYLNKNYFILYGYSLFACFFVVKLLKKIIKKQRPDKTNLKSFPSGHCSHSSVGFFFTLHFIDFSLYGIIIMILLLIVFIFVILSRLLFKRHDILDILGGILIGFFFGYIFSNILYKIFLL